MLEEHKDRTFIQMEETIIWIDQMDLISIKPWATKVTKWLLQAIWLEELKDIFIHSSQEIMYKGKVI